jgi:hypothetical protein
MVMPVSYVVCTLGIVYFFDPLLISYVMPVTGEIEYDNGIYEGRISKKQEHGIGTWKLTSGEAKGEKYVGEWKDGKKHGQGTYTFPDGEKYVGEFKDGKYYGQGTYIHGKGEFEGVKYVGKLRGDKWWEGTQYDRDGKVMGTWSEGAWSPIY